MTAEITVSALRARVSELEAAEARLKEAEAALGELVRLKDGPRDDAYRATKDAAWDRAREFLSTGRGR